MAKKAVALALKKVAGENRVGEGLVRGDPLRDVFSRHGIL